MIGLFFDGPLFWSLFTVLLARLLRKSIDVGIDNHFIKEMGNSLEPSHSGLLI
jgi:uncharacterized membrane protein